MMRPPLFRIHPINFQRQRGDGFRVFLVDGLAAYHSFLQFERDDAQLLRVACDACERCVSATEVDGVQPERNQYADELPDKYCRLKRCQRCLLCGSHYAGQLPSMAFAIENVKMIFELADRSTNMWT